MIFCNISPTRLVINPFLSLRVIGLHHKGQHIEALVRPATWFPKYWTIGQERHQNLAASIPLCLEGSQRRQWPISSPEVACFKVWYLEFVAQGSRHLLLPVLFARCMSTCPSTSSPPQRAKGVEVTRSEAGQRAAEKHSEGTRFVNKLLLVVHSCTRSHTL